MLISFKNYWDLYSISVIYAKKMEFGGIDGLMELWGLYSISVIYANVRNRGTLGNAAAALNNLASRICSYYIGLMELLELG